MKSRHVLYYVFGYDKVNLSKIPGVVEFDVFDNEFYYNNFKSLFRSKKILTYNIDLYDGLDFVINNEAENVNFKVADTRLRVVSDYNIAILEVTVENFESSHYTFIARHIDKNIRFSENDSFRGITIDSKPFITGCMDVSHTVENINKLFFKEAFSNIKFILGRKNYQIMAIVSDELSAKVLDVKSGSDLEIYRIAMAEHTTDIGDDSFEEFRRSIYDKWLKTGSLYIVNNLKMLQIVDVKSANFISASTKTYKEIVTLTLIQKAVFVRFQTVHQSSKDIKKFSDFINKYYFIEVSYDNQSQAMYLLLLNEMNNKQYYSILKEEINILNSQMTTRTMIILTAIYTFFSVASVLIAIYPLLT